MNFEKIRKYEEENRNTAKETGVAAEDIMREDAAKENKHRELLLRKSPHGDMLDLEKESSSALTVKVLENGNYLLKGIINGKNIEIEARWEDNGHGKRSIVKSLEDGELLDVEEAEKIFEEYIGIALQRTENIKAMAEQDSGEKSEQEHI